MDCLPDQLVWEILDRIEKTADRNSLSLTCKRLKKLDGEHRKFIRVGCRLVPAAESLTCICSRFPYLERVEIDYSGWMSNLGKQLDDEGIRVLSSGCPFLNDLTLSYCAFITDAGLSPLALCSNLSAFKLKFAPRVTGCGIVSLVIGCKKLTLLHLIRCFNVSSAEWLEYLGTLGTLEDLCVKNCRAISEGDLVKLGPGWGALKRLHFEVDVNYRYMKSCDRIAIDRWHEQRIPCKNMLELTLVNCIISPGKGLSCILGKCENLAKIRLHLCTGLRDSDIISLAEKAKGLRSISLQIPSDHPLQMMTFDPLRLTDKSLEALAKNCSQLDSVKLCYSGDKFPTYSSLTLDGITFLIQLCPIRELVLDRIDCFSDVGMGVLCSASCLEVLEITRCEEITDEGLSLLGRFPRLRVFRMSKCMGVTDDGFRPLSVTRKLEELSVEGCPLVSERGVQGAAKCVAYSQDLSWIYSGT